MAVIVVAVALPPGEQVSMAQSWRKIAEDLGATKVAFVMRVLAAEALYGSPPYIPAWSAPPEFYVNFAALDTAYPALTYSRVLIQHTAVLTARGRAFTPLKTFVHPVGDTVYVLGAGRDGLADITVLGTAWVGVESPTAVGSSPLVMLAHVLRSRLL